jgi:beta-galactosidase
MAIAGCIIMSAVGGVSEAQPAVELPPGVTAVWDVSKAYRETTPTRERICINGLWRWQPAEQNAADTVPGGNWGHFKVPGCWPGITDYMQKDFQTVYAHPSWQERELGGITAAWYQREITVPAKWAGRRIAVSAEYLNSYAAVYVDGKRAGEILFPSGEVDLTAVCSPGRKHVLSMLVVAMPLKGAIMSFSDTNSAKQVKGSVARRGPCGDVYLVGSPSGARIADVRVNTSVRKGQITFGAALLDLPPDVPYSLRALVSDKGRQVGEFTSETFRAGDLVDGRIAFTETWKPDKLWDTHTPENMNQVSLSLLSAGGKALDTGYPVRFGFREFWIDGRDFYLNGTRIFLSAVPLDNAQVGAAVATYEAAKESLLRLKSFGINFVYTHNYGCEPGSHLSFAEILRAADDVGMLVALSQPHFGHYEWDGDDADQTNGYARHADFYTRVAQNHPSIVAYSTSHNGTGYSEDMNPHLMDGIQDPRSDSSKRNAARALRAEAIIKGLDPHRIVYHHSSGNLSSMHTANFYPNFVPMQEMSDWFEHWATEGVKPVFLCEYGAPFTWDWTMYRGWYKGSREFGSAVVPWEYCLAEWSAQFFGDEAFQITEMEKENLRWEAEQMRAGQLWHRWDYPHIVGSKDFDLRHDIIAAYTTDNSRAHRTWGLSANSPWQHGHFHRPRAGFEANREELKVDWANLQRPGLSPDYIDDRYERWDLAFERSDWDAMPEADALRRNNMPLLAYIGGKPAAFTSKDHNFHPGEAVEKQLIVINNSRETVTCECTWSFGIPRPASGSRQTTVETGQQLRIPLQFELPADLAPGTYELTASVKFSSGETQTDAFSVHVMAPAEPAEPDSKIALFDPEGETGDLLAGMGVRCATVDADSDLSAYDVLVIGKGALTVDGPGPDLDRVRQGLRVIVFEQTTDALEKRLGFRVAEYGLRQVFKRVPDHPLLAGLDLENLRDWRGEATILPPTLEYQRSPTSPPTVKWCGIDVPRLWRCGCRGNVASVLIEKPTRGDFLPITDGGYSLQYSPLMEYREGQGMVLFCQMDVTGRTETDPAAETLTRNIVRYVSDWKPAPRRKVLYAGDPAGRRHLEFAGLEVGSYDGDLSAGSQVLVVGPGGGRQLAGSAPAIGRFLKDGGNLLALGLDEADANALLPFEVRMQDDEHIASFFEPSGVRSLLAGVGPADVHNRDPRELPLVTGGASVVGNGVLAMGEDTNVVFCQLPPHTVSSAEGAVPSLVVDAEDAADGKQSALLTMGSASEWGGQFGQKLDETGSVGKTYTFSVLLKGVGGPVLAHLELERAANPWDRALKTEKFPVAQDEWTELHATFKVETPYPQGWAAYIGCAQEGARLRADMFRLYEGEYVPWQAGDAERANLFANPSFETGSDPWWFRYRDKGNVRRTYRRASFLQARLLANMGASGRTPLLSHFSTPPGGGGSGESLVKNGDFSVDADGDGVGDDWTFSGGSREASAGREPVAPGSDDWCQRLTCPGFGDKESGTVMLSQHDIAVEQGQWYRVSLRAKAQGLDGAYVTVALQDTENWRSLLSYQRFSPGERWERFAFLVQAAHSAETNTRFQIWHGNIATVWFSDMRIEPCDPPSEGRWLAGLYLDEPAEWDDPYRFFRW